MRLNFYGNESAPYNMKWSSFMNRELYLLTCKFSSLKIDALLLALYSPILFTQSDI